MVITLATRSSNVMVYLQRHYRDYSTNYLIANCALRAANAPELIAAVGASDEGVNGDYDLWIKDNAGNYLGVIHPATNAVNIGLADNSTATGVWLIDGADIFGLEVFGAIALASAMAHN